MVDVASTFNGLVNAVIPTVIAASVFVTYVMHLLLNRTTNPRLQKVEQDVLKGANDIDNIANNVQNNQQTISNAVGVIGSMTPALQSLVEKYQDRIAAVEDASTTADQKITELTQLLAQLQDPNSVEDAKKIIAAKAQATKKPVASGAPVKA